MKVFAYLSLLCLFPAFSSAIIGTSEEILQEFLHLPKCGINCTLPVLLELDCNLKNVTEIAPCLCRNVRAERKVADCVLEKCTYEELVKVEKLQYNLCFDEPRPSRRPNLIAVTVILTVLTTIMVGARCLSRYTISKQFWWDDWFILFSLATFLGVQANNFWGIYMGFGVHVWNVNPDLNVQLYQYEWIYQILYAVATATTKISVVLLYYRIFPQTWLHKTIWCAIGLIIIVFFIFFFLVIFQCNPMALVFDKTLTGKCLDFHAIIFAGAIITVVEDVVVICLPIPSILKLRLRFRKKMEVILIMSIGLIAVICSLVRMKFVVAFNYSIDINWDDFSIAAISMIELSVSIMCVCFPAVKLLLNHSWPKCFASSGALGVHASLQVHLSGGSTTDSLPKSLLRRMQSAFSSMLGLSRSRSLRSKAWSDSESPLESLPRINQDTLAGTMNRSVERLRSGDTV